MAEKTQEWWVYIIVTETGSLYTGISTDIHRRFKEHSDDSSGKGAKYFRSNKPVSIVFKEPHIGRSEASKREAYIKKLSRRQKCELIGREYKPIKRKD